LLIPASDSQSGEPAQVMNPAPGSIAASPVPSSISARYSSAARAAAVAAFDGPTGASACVSSSRHATTSGETGAMSIGICRRSA